MEVARASEDMHTYLLAYLLNYLLTYFLACLLAYLLTYLLAYLLTYLLTYLPTPWSRALLENVTGLQPVKKFPAFYGTRRFITEFTCPFPEPARSKANSLAAAVTEPALYRLLTFQVPNLVSLFHCLDRTKVSVQV